jgi:hypothetical protein
VPDARPKALESGKGPLEKLNLKFVNNRYSQPRSGEYIMFWSPHWSSYSERYGSLQAAQQHLPIFGADSSTDGTELLAQMRRELRKMGSFLSSFEYLLDE